MIGTWKKLTDGDWGVCTKGRARIGSIVTVRFKDRREPSTVTVEKVLETFTDENGQERSLCTIERRST